MGGRVTFADPLVDRVQEVSRWWHTVQVTRTPMTRGEKRRSDDLLAKDEVHDDEQYKDEKCRMNYDMLHKLGFVVLRKTFTMDPESVNNIHSAVYEPIFNGTSEDGTLTYDKKRLQTKTTRGKWRTVFIKALEDYLHPYGFLKSKTINHAYALKSVAGCPMQPRHTDSAAEGSLRGASRDTVPLAVLYALQDNTRLQVWNFDTGQPAVIFMNATDLVVFRGDAAHAGYSYEFENVRLHAYLDSDSVKRQKGNTFV